MTLEELDDALTKVFGFDFTKQECRKVRDKIMELHGKYLLKAKEGICQTCWLRENKGCNPSCQYYNVSSNPIEVSKEYLEHPNDISIFPFLCMFVIPLYEKATGEHDTMKKLTLEYRKRWKDEHRHEKHEYI